MTEPLIHVTFPHDETVFRRSARIVHPLDAVLEELKAAIGNGQLPQRYSDHVWVSTAGNADGIHVMVGWDDGDSIRVRIIGPGAAGRRMSVDVSSHAPLSATRWNSLMCAWDDGCERLLREGSAPP